jgi:hypothetical protein
MTDQPSGHRTQIATFLRDRDVPLPDKIRISRFVDLDA